MTKTNRMTTSTRPNGDLGVTEIAAPGSGSSKQPPRWLGRALLMIGLAIFAWLFVWYAMGTLQSLGANLLIAFFLALVLEPTVLWLVRHGWKRGAAAGVTLIGAVVFIMVLIALFGNLFLQQIIQLGKNVPTMYEQIQAFATERFNVVIPESDSLVEKALSSWGDDVASGALWVGAQIVGFVFAGLMIMLVTFYLLAAGPKFRAAICSFVNPERQIEVLRVWDITQSKVSSFVSSRVVLALICAAATFAFLTAFKTPYSLPLALFTGLVSQFVPTIGTYIGGALPIVVALTAPGQGVKQAILILAFIIGYQQFENLWLAPKISAKAMEMNPAVSFVVVIAFGSVFGALGAFLALPVAATIQAASVTYVRRHELINSEMLKDPGSARTEDATDSDGLDSAELGEDANATAPETEPAETPSA